jgi:hypothetical protein
MADVVSDVLTGLKMTTVSDADDSCQLDAVCDRRKVKGIGEWFVMRG